MGPNKSILRIIFMASVFSSAHEGAASVAKPGCPEKCGNLTVPFPFGIGKDCYLNEIYEVFCNATLQSAELGWLNAEVHKIEKDYVEVTSYLISFHYNKSSGQSSSGGPQGFGYTGDYYSFSRSRNKFIAVGCDIFAYITDERTKEFVAGCPSLCGDQNISSWPSSSSCLGNRCCQTIIPKDLTNLTVWVHTMNTLARSWASNQCSFTGIVQKDFTDFNKFDLSRCDDSYHLPHASLMLDWAIGNISCREALKSTNYTCGQNSECLDSARGLGYLCTCLPGYQGNPYLRNGCQDIDECRSPEKNKCPKETVCVNTPGSYFCSCPPGYHSDSSNPSPFVPVCLRDRGRKRMVTFISLGAGLTFGLLVLVASSLWQYQKIKKSKKNKAKKKLFRLNGGLLLQQQMSSTRGNVLETKIFISEELEKATDNFNESRILGKGGLGTVYKGILSDGSIVAVKKSNKIDEQQLSQFINEVLILSQISHRHIVKLLGCCLETEVPLLVYEYVPNGTLSNHLHDDPNAAAISWENRLRIAAEVAGALAYLHSYASTAIFHRDIKSSNILLDENYRAVVSDFGLSRSVSVEKTHLTTLVGGTLGYLDPEYLRTGQLNDKSDVYAFGVVLAELLTGQKAVSSSRSDEGLVIQFRTSIKENRLFQLVESIVSSEGQQEEIAAVADLAKRCLKFSARKRPCMKEVAAELEQLGRTREGSMPEESFQENYENYRSTSERSYSCTFSMFTEDSREFL